MPDTQLPRSLPGERALHGRVNRKNSETNKKLISFISDENITSQAKQYLISMGSVS